MSSNKSSTLGKASVVGSRAPVSGPPKVSFEFWGPNPSKSIPNIAWRELGPQRGPLPNAFIVLYGSLTGDIWHVAAAQILSQYTKTGSNTPHPFPKINIRSCITGMDFKTDDTVTMKRAKGSWEYLKSIDVPTALVLVPTKQGQAVVGFANNNLSHAIVQDCFGKQMSWALEKNIAFDQTLEYLKEKNKGKGEPSGDGPQGDPGLIDIWCSTTIVMQMMEHLGVAESQKILGYHLSGGANLSATAKNLAESKFLNLCTKIKEQVKARKDRKPAVATKGVVLFNFRMGDVNKQHDSNMDIFRQVRSLCDQRGYLLLAIPQVGTKEWTAMTDKPQANEIFDLLDVLGPGTEKTDNTVKAYFWHLVATYLQGSLSPFGPSETTSNLAKACPEKNVPVIGLIGGRSGSTDLPAFVGLRVFSWEEPLLEDKAYWAKLKGTITNQGPQMARLLNQHPLVVTGFLDLASTQQNNTKRYYKLLDASSNSVLIKWLDKTPQRDIRPLIPARVKAAGDIGHLENVLNTNGILKIEKSNFPNDLQSPQITAVSLRNDWYAEVPRPRQAGASSSSQLRQSPSTSRPAPQQQPQQMNIPLRPAPGQSGQGLRSTPNPAPAPVQTRQQPQTTTRGPAPSTQASGKSGVQKRN